MKGLILLLFSAAVVWSQELDVNATKRWMLAVEEILSSVSLGPLKAEFTPEYLGQRTLKSALQSQASRFRAKVSRAMIECAGTKAIVCIDSVSISDKAVKLVFDELKKLGFTVEWNRYAEQCFGTGALSFGQALVITMPPPAAESKE